MVGTIPFRAAPASLGCIRTSLISCPAFSSFHFERIPFYFNCLSPRSCTVRHLWSTHPAAGAALSSNSNTPFNLFANGNQQNRKAHKFAAPDCPNLLKLREAVERNFHPICFYIKNDYAMGHHVYDQHFYGILCSPLFEGKTYGQINAMVDRVLEPLGLKGRVKLHCQPPSRFDKMKHRVRWRWQLEK